MTAPYPTGTPMPDGNRLHRLAASLARPVARGWLSPSDAMGSLAAFTFTAKRKGRRPRAIQPLPGRRVRHALAAIPLDQQRGALMNRGGPSCRGELARLRIRRLLRTRSIGTRKRAEAVTSPRLRRGARPKRAAPKRQLPEIVRLTEV